MDKKCQLKLQITKLDLSGGTNPTLPVTGLCSFSIEEF